MPILSKPNFFVLTGGPGVGKTTLLDHLARLGEQVVSENARAVIRDELAAGGEGVPWRDNDRFVALTTARDIADFDGRAAETRRVFFDRATMDMYGANGAIPTPHLIEVIRTRRYNPRVFVLPPWREIYETDAERRQDWPEAQATFGQIIAMLPTLGYEPVVVPTGPVATRAAFLLAHAVG
jgi:predicted ATPase